MFLVARKGPPVGLVPAREGGGLEPLSLSFPIGLGDRGRCDDDRVTVSCDDALFFLSGQLQGVSAVRLTLGVVQGLV